MRPGSGSVRGYQDSPDLTAEPAIRARHSCFVGDAGEEHHAGGFAAHGYWSVVHRRVTTTCWSRNARNDRRLHPFDGPGVSVKPMPWKSVSSITGTPGSAPCKVPALGCPPSIVTTSPLRNLPDQIKTPEEGIAAVPDCAGGGCGAAYSLSGRRMPGRAGGDAGLDEGKACVSGGDGSLAGEGAGIFWLTGEAASGVEAEAAGAEGGEYACGAAAPGGCGAGDRAGASPVWGRKSGSRSGGSFPRLVVGAVLGATAPVVRGTGTAGERPGSGNAASERGSAGCRWLATSTSEGGRGAGAAGLASTGEDATGPSRPGRFPANSDGAGVLWNCLYAT